MKEKHSKYHVLKPVIPEIADWPINKISEDRDAFVKEINDFTLKRIMQQKNEKIEDMIAKTIYKERIRIKEEPWKVDPPNDKQFWNKIRKRLINKSLDKEEDTALASNEEILKRIIGRYSEEIVGTFNIGTFKFARRFLTFFFNRLLNTAANRNLARLYGQKYSIHDRLIAGGQVEVVRKLMKKGTVVVAPTHFSNLDSILIGYIMDAIAGLPFFCFGAGLNLYNTGYTAYFMNRLGAYRIDRRKKNPIYLETLKGMSNLSVQRGVNSLFFPGGTRSRSGAFETKFKLGLLGTVVEAQRANLEKPDGEKIFVVPLILGYHFVLEAEFLIEEHLKRTGKEHYLRNKDQSYSTRKMLRFIWDLFSESNEIHLTFGQPMDVLGNPVNENGVSFDKYGNELDIKDYFLSNGKIKEDLQRDNEYTKILGEKIIDRFHKDNYVLSSHLVAYAGFKLVEKQNAKLDLYGLLRLPPEDYIFRDGAMEHVVAQLQKRLFEMRDHGEILLSPEIELETKELIKNGISKLGSYHALKPLKYDKKTGELKSDNFKTLYYYHNRLENYNLHKHVNWKQEEPALAFVNMD